MPKPFCCSNNALRLARKLYGKVALSVLAPRFTAAAVAAASPCLLTIRAIEWPSIQWTTIGPSLNDGSCTESIHRTDR